MLVKLWKDVAFSIKYKSISECPSGMMTAGTQRWEATLEAGCKGKMLMPAVVY